MSEEINYGDPEPSREGVYRDKDGDFWWWDTNEEAWIWSNLLIHAKKPGRGTGGYPWRSLHGGLFPMTRVHENAPATGFTVKDSGAREEYANGFVRDTEDGKYDYSRILQIEGLHLIPVEALERWAAHMVKGAEKYGEDNWRQARGPVAVARFLRSLCRHAVQYIRKDRTEDHAAAVCFNVWAAELTPEED